MNPKTRNFLMIGLPISLLFLMSCALGPVLGPLVGQTSTSTAMPPATSAPLPTAAAPATTAPLASAVPAVPSGSTVLFQDDFSSNSNGWVVGKVSDDSGTLDREIAGGKYHLTLTSKQSYDYAITNVPNFSGKDFLFSIELTVLNSSATSGDLMIGVTLREPDGVNGKRYDFSLKNDNSYSVVVWPSADYQTIQDLLSGTLPVSLMEKGKTNTLAIQAQGSTFTIFMNGIQVDSFTDTTIDQAGEMDLWLGLMGANESVSLELDNLSIKPLP